MGLGKMEVGHNKFMSLNQKVSLFAMTNHFVWSASSRQQARKSREDEQENNEEDEQFH